MPWFMIWLDPGNQILKPLAAPIATAVSVMANERAWDDLKNTNFLKEKENEKFY